MRVIAIDIGNSFSKVGWRDQDGLRHVSRVPTTSLGESLGAHLNAGDRIGFCSVVPAASAALRDLLSCREWPSAFEVSHRVRLPFQMGYRTPETLGNDRIAAAAGALLAYGREGSGVLVVDAGTAVTYEVVTADRVYRGGAIAPGPLLQAGALRTGTAQLPEVSDPPSGGPIGDSTLEAIRSGVWWGFVDAVRGMVERLRAESGPVVTVLTGGWAAYLSRELADFDIVDPHLVLDGVLRLMELNATPAPRPS